MQSAETIRIAMVPKSVGNSAFELARIGAEEASVELDDVELIYTGPPLPSTDAQIGLIEALAADGVDVIAVDANDPTALVPAVERAVGRGIKLFTWDSGLAPKGRLLHLCPVGDQAFAAAMVGLMAAAVGNAGDIAIVSTTPEAGNQNRWIAAMRRLLAEPAHRHLNLVTTVYGLDIPETSYDVARALLAAHPNIQGIIVPSGVGLVATARAVEDMGLIGRVHVTGLGYPSEMVRHVECGAVKGFAVWRMIDFGYATMQVAYQLARHAATGAVGESIPIGRMGALKIGANREAVMDAPIIYDAANVHIGATEF